MKIVIAPDKFRGSLTASQAARAIERGVLRADSNAIIEIVRVADGGEGFVEAWLAASGGTQLATEVDGPVGHRVQASLGLLRGGHTAVLEMATASGLALVPVSERDPSRTTTRGTGDLIRVAIEQGARHLIVGVGGSATNDGGAGMAQALGYRLVDKHGADLPPGGGALDRLDRIESDRVLSELRNTSIVVACDVANPLCGPQGASFIYGPQKGATPDQVVELDANLEHLAAVVLRDLHVEIRDLPGGGAAGGLAAGLVAFAGAKLQSGIDLMIEAANLADRLRGADLCFTGEGLLDASTASGKTVAGIVRLAQVFNVPAVVLAGTIGPGAEAILEQGASAYFSLCPRPATLDQAILKAEDWLATIAEQVTRIFLVGRSSGHH